MTALKPRREIALVFALFFAAQSPGQGQCDVPQEVQAVSFPAQVWRDVAVSFKKLLTPDKGPLRKVHHSIDDLLDIKTDYLRRLVRYSKSDPTMDWISLKQVTSRLLEKVVLVIAELKSAGDTVPAFRDDESYKKLDRGLDAKRLSTLCEIDRSTTPLTLERARELSKDLGDEITAIDKADDELITLLKSI